MAEVTVSLHHIRISMFSLKAKTYEKLSPYLPAISTVKASPMSKSWSLSILSFPTF